MTSSLVEVRLLAPARTSFGGKDLRVGLLNVPAKMAPFIHHTQVARELAARPVIAGETASGSWAAALRVPSGVVAHGLAGMLVSIATVSALSASDLREGLLRLLVGHELHPGRAKRVQAPRAGHFFFSSGASNAWSGGVSGVIRGPSLTSSRMISSRNMSRTPALPRCL